MANLAIENDAAWHALRAKHVGASETAALHGLSRYLTKWQLYMQKTGKLPRVDLSDNKAVQRGKWFEPAIAGYAAEKFGLQLRKVKRYLSADDTPGMGCSLDYEAYGDGALIPVEIKLSMFGDGWDYAGDEITAAPDDFVLQCQHQLGCMPSAPYSLLIADVGYDMRMMKIPRRDSLIAIIKDAVREFWADVAAGKEPPVDFLADADAIATLVNMSPLRKVALPGTEGLFRDYLAAADNAKRAEEDATRAKAELQKRLLDACRGVNADDEKIIATCGAFKMTVSRVAANPGKIVDESMIGTVVGARRGYDRVTISEVKEKKNG